MKKLLYKFKENQLLKFKGLTSLLFIIFLFNVQNAASQIINIGALTHISIFNNGAFVADNTADRWSRHVVVYPEGTGVENIAHGNNIRRLDFQRWIQSGYNTGSLVDSTRLRIYLRNRITPSLGSGDFNWNPELDTAVLVYEGNPTSILGTGAGWKEFDFNVNVFEWDTTNGKNLQVMIEYYQVSAQPQLGNGLLWIGTDSDYVSAYQYNEFKFDIGTGTPDSMLSQTNIRRPNIIIHANYEKDIAVEQVYALGQLPLTYGSPDTISAYVINLGLDNVQNFEVYLNVTGANTFADTVTIPSLSTYEDTIIKFKAFTPTNLGTNLISISVNADDNTSNDEAVMYQIVSENVFAHADTLPPDYDWGFAQSSAGAFVARYYVHGPKKVAAVEVRISDDTRIIGETLYGVVYNSSGVLVGRSDVITMTANDIDGYYTFYINEAPEFDDEYFYVGLYVDQIVTFRPLSVRNQSPVKPNSFFIRFGTLVPSNVDYSYMIHAVLAQEDAGVEAVVEPADSICGLIDQKIEVTIKNHGNIYLTDFDVTAIVSGDLQDTITAIYTDTIFSGDSRNFILGTFNSIQGGNINIQVFTSLTEDADRSNDTLHYQAYIVPAPSLPDVPDDSLCHRGVVTLSGTNTDNLSRWYLSPTSPNAVHTGASYTTPQIQATFSFFVSNYSADGCASERKSVQVKVNPKPNVPAMLQGTLFEGNFNTGNLQDPDDLCPANTLSYELPPPNGYNNSDYGNTWSLSVSLMTSGGFPSSAFNLDAPTANDNALVTFYSTTADADSVFKLTANYTIYPTLCTDSSSRYISVNSIPDVSFTVENQCEKSLTAFTNSSSIIQGNLIDFEWDFGDGVFSNDMDPVHTYNNTGTYSVNLKVTSDALCTNETTVEVDIYELAVPDFANASQCAMDTFQFVNLSSYSAGSSVLSYEWDFGFNDETSGDFEPLHFYTNSGLFNVSLKAISPDGCADSVSKTLEVFELPKAEFEVEDACANSNLVLNNKSEGLDLVSHWSFGNGNEATAHEPAYAYVTHGNYEIVLTVTDINGCTNSYLTEVSILELPEAGFMHTESMGTVSFTPNDANGISYEWNFGDGKSSTEVSPEHEYAENGTYEVSLKIEGVNGCFNEEIRNITLSSVSLETIAGRNSLNLEIYPNPFTNEAVISYELHKNMDVSIVLYDLTGRKLAEIDKGSKTAGTHTVILNTSDTGLADGIYMLHMQAGSEVVVRKIVK